VRAVGFDRAADLLLPGDYHAARIKSCVAVICSKRLHIQIIYFELQREFHPKSEVIANVFNFTFH
jgi:hypothetical protein